MISIFTAAYAWKFLTQKRLENELRLQYELDQEKRKLELYSTQLEQLVQERTKELNKSELMFRSLFEYATDGVMILDRDGKIINVNQRACEIHGFDRGSLIGTNIKLLEAEENMPVFKERMERILNGESLLFETQHYRKDGSKVSLEVSTKAIEVEGNILIQSFQRDITEKKSIQEQLAHSQKMESIGLLAGGIAHNFNNILTAILGYVELLQDDDTLDDTSKKRLRNIEGAARKATEMISKLLSFARIERHEILPLNLHDVVNDTVKLIGSVIDKRIEIRIDLTNNIPVVEGDPNQLEQVIMNLIVNARDSMPDGGVISIKTRMTEVKRDVSDMPAYITPGRYILLTISDTGCGIPKEMVNRIFEPFFTTKERGKGTGLGLAMVYGIIKDHKGYITVQSGVGKGSTFDIYLPVSDKTIYIHKDIKPHLFSVAGQENILVVDDEEDVLDFIKDILETHGYKVLPVNNPITAIDIFKKSSGEIELVITDIIMPLMEGKELIRNLRAIKPDIKIIAISGYTDEVISKDKMMIDEFLRKPFEGSLLLSIVRR
ncbi:MAG: PAS domain S-box protein, partial [Nitrospirota bacterium]